MTNVSKHDESEIAFGDSSLAHEIKQTRELPLTNDCFRLLVQGITPLKLLGEDVPNFEYYFRD